VRVLGSILQLIGLSTTSAGGYMLEPWLGVMLAGCGLFAVGYQLEREAVTA
jgi:hypothetical protein